MTPGRAFRNKGHCAKQERMHGPSEIAAALSQSAQKSGGLFLNCHMARESGRGQPFALARRLSRQRFGIRAPGAPLPVFVDIGSFHA